jgi:hypothetical protein
MRQQRARGRLGADVRTDWLLVRGCSMRCPYLYCRMRAPLDRGASSVSSTPRSKASTSTSPGGSGTEPGHAAVHTRSVMRATAQPKAPCLGLQSTSAIAKGLARRGRAPQQHTCLVLESGLGPGQTVPCPRLRTRGQPASRTCRYQQRGGVRRKQGGIENSTKQRNT